MSAIQQGFYAAFGAQCAMPVEITVAVDGSSTTAIHYPAAANPASGAVLVLAHGAGAGQRHPFMVSVARSLAAHGIDVVTFNFLYTEQRRRVPDKTPALEACFRRVIQVVQEQPPLAMRPLFIGGKSMGGRMATHLAAADGNALSGVVVLGYPLHPPGKPDQLRIAHLPAIDVPMLIVQGERDAFGTPSELAPVIASMRAAVTLHVVAGGDHSLAVRGQPHGAIDDAVMRAIQGWMADVLRSDF
jgi:uncharacterized protein